MKPSIDVLPDDVMILILEQLDNRSMMSAMKSYNKLVKNTKLILKILKNLRSKIQF